MTVLSMPKVFLASLLGGAAGVGTLVAWNQFVTDLGSQQPWVFVSAHVTNVNWLSALPAVLLAGLVAAIPIVLALPRASKGGAVSIWLVMSAVLLLLPVLHAFLAVQLLVSAAVLVGLVVLAMRLKGVTLQWDVDTCHDAGSNGGRRNGAGV